nr:NAD-dependent epimerase/dehydratase family protein [Planosporangium thailandense]
MVTGGLGFLGHAVTADLLATGHQVTVLSRGRPGARPPEGAGLVEGDIRDRARIGEIISAGGYDAVCHLAALIRVRDSFADPLSYYDVNVGGTLNVLMALDAVRDRVPAPGPRLVFASTNAVCGSQHAGALHEEVPARPESPYAASKLSAEQLVAAHTATGSIGAVTLRCFNLAGATDGYVDADTSRIIPNVFRALTGELPHVTLNGDGSAVRDFVHVRDVAVAVRLALAAARPGRHRLYHVGSGIGSSMAEVVRVAGEVAGRPVAVEHLPPSPEPQRLVADNSRITHELGWRPERSGLRRILSDAWTAWLSRSPAA